MLNKKEIEIIAEVAQGFEGNFQQSKLLIKAAAKSGANSVKFQLVYADELATPSYKYFNLFKNLEMDENNWRELKTYADELGINLYLDIFGLKSLSLAEKINVEVVKIHGTDITNINLLSSLSKSKVKKIIIGVGGAEWQEIKKAILILKNKELIILLGFQGYPTKTDTNQLERLKYLKNKIKKINSNFKIGYADHPIENYMFNTIAVLAIGAGARVIEKHITLGKVMELEDYESALNPDDFFDFSKIVRNAYEAFIGYKESEDFGMSDSEKKYRKNVRRHVVCVSDLKKGTIINENHITLKRSSAVSFIQNIDEVYGKELTKDLSENTTITHEHLI